MASVFSNVKVTGDSTRGMGVRAYLERIQKGTRKEELDVFGIILFPTTGIVALFMKLKLKLLLINDSTNILQNTNAI